MNSRNHAACPAELHDSGAAGTTLVWLYRSQEECAFIHGCEPGKSCPIEDKWKARGNASQGSWGLFAFIARAFAGPRNRP